MTELTWIAKGCKHIGLRKSRQQNITRHFLNGLSVGHCLGITDRYVVKNLFRASAWADSQLMTKLYKPAYGCIVTFTRKGGGQVGFVVGKDTRGNLMVLGGSQGNAVSIAAFLSGRATGFY